MLFSVCFIPLIATLLSTAAAALSRTHYAPNIIPSAWKNLSLATASDSIEFTFVFASDYTPLTQRMEQIASDHSAWLTETELAAYVGPSDTAKSAVQDAIKELSGTVLATSALGDKVTINTTIENASKYFSATFYQYQLDDQATTPRTHAYTLPASISPHVSDIYPISTFGAVKSLARVVRRHPTQSGGEKPPIYKRAAAPSQCSTNATTSDCYRALYGYDSYTPTANSSTNVSVAIMGYIGQNFSPDDLATWLDKYRPEAAGYTIGINTTSGAFNNASEPGIEAALDTQTVAGIIYPLPSVFFDVGTANTTADIFLMTFQHFIDTQLPRPPVVTISYGSEENFFTSVQATTMCDAAQQLTALGTTIVVSSGDYGVDGQHLADETCPPFQVTYPSGCPWLLSVGATQDFSPEVMTNTTLAGFYSGAGFSSFWSTPSYQSEQVAAYIDSMNGLNQGDYAASGRAFPDVSAQGSLQPVVGLGDVYLVGGTSASTPIVAGGLALLNDLLTRAGKPTTGWIHPTLYASPSAFTDITSGGSYGCNNSLGFPALSSWDASAGLGTPLFSGLRAAYGV